MKCEYEDNSLQLMNIDSNFQDMNNKLKPFKPRACLKNPIKGVDKLPFSHTSATTKHKSVALWEMLLELSKEMENNTKSENFNSFLIYMKFKFSSVF